MPESLSVAQSHKTGLSPEPPDSAAEQMEALRRLLLGADHGALQDLKQRLLDPEVRAQDVAEVLADALWASSRRDPERLANSLKEPLAPAITAAIIEKPEEITSALYPVIMPAIRRAIADSLRQMMERIDTMVNQKLSTKALKWRFEAMRTGVPFHDLVLRDTLVFRVEQVLMIDNGSGQLMQHVYSNLATKTDSDTVSGMLWAIESFMRDAFTGSDDGALSRVTMGGQILYLVHGPEATLACLVRGVATPEYLEKVSAMVETLHGRYGRAIHQFSGNKSDLDMLRPLLVECLETEYRQPSVKQTSRKLQWLSLLLAAILLLGAGAWSLQAYQERRQAASIAEVVASLNQKPGVLVQHSERIDDGWVLKGMYDPVVGDPQALLDPAMPMANQIHFELVPFYSLDPRLILARARQQLAIPAALDATLQHGEMRLSGVADLVWYLQWEKPQTLPAGVSRINLDALRLAPPEVAELLQVNPGMPSSVHLDVGSDRLSFSGSATSAWMEQLQHELAPLRSGISVDMDELQILDEARLAALAEELQQITISFTELVSPSPTPPIDAIIAQMLTPLQELLQLGAALQKQIVVTVYGRSGARGAEDVNLQLRRQRAQFVADKLIAAGVPATALRLSDVNLSAVQLQQLGEAARRVDLGIEIQ